MGSVIAWCSGSESSRCVASLPSNSCKSKKTARLTADDINEHAIAMVGNEEITSVCKVTTRLGVFKQDGEGGHLLSITERALGAWHDELYFVYVSCGCLRACRLSWTQDGLEERGLSTFSSWTNLSKTLAQTEGHAGVEFYDVCKAIKMELVVDTLKVMVGATGRRYDIRSFNCQQFCAELLSALPIAKNERLSMAPLPGQDTRPQASHADLAGTAAGHPTAEAANPPMSAGMEMSLNTVSSHSIQDSQEDGAAEGPAFEQAQLNTQAAVPQDEEDYNFV